MRKLIILLNSIYGAEHNAEITHFVNEQFCNTSHCENLEFSLRDLDENKIETVVKELIAEYDLTLHELLTGVMLIPCLSENKAEFCCIAEFKPSLFQSLLAPAFHSVYGLVKGEDSFEYYGRDAHMFVVKNSECSQAVICAGYINATMHDGIEVCVFMDKEEMAGVRNSYTTIKYGGTAPIYQEVWDEILQSSLFRRLQTEPMFERIMNACGANSERISKILAHGSGAFSKKEFENGMVISSWGKQIAKKVIVYTAGEEKRLAEVQKVNLSKINARHLQVVVDNSAVVDEVHQVNNGHGEEVQTEWGNF